MCSYFVLHYEMIGRQLPVPLDRSLQTGHFPSNEQGQRTHRCCAHGQYHHALASQTSWHVSVEFCARTWMRWTDICRLHLLPCRCNSCWHGKQHNICPSQHWVVMLEDLAVELQDHMLSELRNAMLIWKHDGFGDQTPWIEVSKYTKVPTICML